MIKQVLSFILALTLSLAANAQLYNLTPESGTVESLQKFTIEFPNATTVARSEAPAQPLLTSSNVDSEGNPIKYTMNGIIRYNGNKVEMTMASAVKDAGTYSFVIPDGYFLVDGEVFPPIIEGRYTILKRINRPTVMPSEGTVTSLKTFRANFFGETSVAVTDIKPYLLFNDTRIDFETITCSGYTMNLTLSSELTQRGTYKLVFPVGSVEDADGQSNLDEFVYNYVVGQTTIVAEASPAPGTYASLPSIDITFKGAVSLTQSFNYSNAPYYESNGTKKMIMSFAVKDNVLTLRPNITAAGDYKVVINVNSLLINGDLNDKEYSFNYTIDPSSSVDMIGEDQRNLPVDVYNLYGAKVASSVYPEDLGNKIPAGIYLIVRSSGSAEKVIIK